jgi:hypothetical protein
VNVSLALPALKQHSELKIAPELELLLVCARRKLSADHEKKARELLDHTIDWKLLIEQAELHRLVPLFYWHVTKSLGFGFPVEVAQELDQRFRANVARTLLLVRDLVSTVELLGNRGIQVIPFKGPVLADNLYGHAALRDCVDLDILVRSGDMPEAIRVLVSAGYHAPTELPPARQNAFIATQYEFGMLSPAGTLVELQWRIVPRYFSLALPEDQYWSRIQSQTVGGRKVNSLSDEDLLLLLCFHGGKHGWTKLIWLADVAELVTSNPQLDWEYVLYNARRAGGLRMLLLAFILANRFLGAAIPGALEQPLSQDSIAKRIAGDLSRNLLAGEYPAYVESQLYLLRVRERWWDRLRYLVRFTFTDTPTEWEVLDLPPAFCFLYRPLRMLRGLVKGWSLALNAISRLAKARL